MSLPSNAFPIVTVSILRNINAGSEIVNTNFEDCDTNISFTKPVFLKKIPNKIKMKIGEIICKVNNNTGIGLLTYKLIFFDKEFYKISTMLIYESKIEDYNKITIII